ncbi:hypothetical protein AB0B88_15930 [Micromonospora haikouensis]|uniref:hypothetical protein n=1 Tax=Micromonospora haikouensis TaxID=686309 RepID=UPI0033E8C235
MLDELDPIDGHTYLTASEVQHRPNYADVTPDLLRTWVHAGKLHRVTCAELATAYGLPTPPDDRANQPAHWPGPSGPENIYRWADIPRVETSTRRNPAGRPRGRTPRRRPTLTPA